MKTLGKLLLVKEMIIQLVLCYIILISKKKKKIKLIAIDLSKQQPLDTGCRAILQINFTANLDQAAGATMFFITEEPKETVIDFL